MKFMRDLEIEFDGDVTKRKASERIDRGPVFLFIEPLSTNTEADEIRIHCRKLEIQTVKREAIDLLFEGKNWLKGQVYLFM